MDGETMKVESIKFCWLDPKKNSDLSLPGYETEYAAGMDICAAVPSSVCLHPGQRILVGTGLAAAIPNGYEIQVRPRSGLAVKHGVTVVNSPGTVDSDYRGEIKIALINLGEKEFNINRGDRVAQLVVAPVIRAKVELVEKLDSTLRGDGGFGHTGV
jgi:dUTP pyrophosphatase